MIWGRTTSEKFTKIYSVSQKFAWLPIQLKDGRWVWWEYVWKHFWTTAYWGDNGYHYERVQ